MYDTDNTDFVDNSYLLDYTPKYRTLAEWAASGTEYAGPYERRMSRQLDETDEILWEVDFAQRVRKGTYRLNQDM